jgi:serine/threonine protein kinase
MTPSRLGPYEIVRSLGAGGMGEVYRARDTQLGREVALKILPDNFSQDAARRARFDLEARAASALNHPNIVTVHDIGEEGGVSYIVIELVEGESLRPLIERGPVPARKLIDIAAQIADGLAAAHAEAARRLFAHLVSVRAREDKTSARMPTWPARMPAPRGLLATRPRRRQFPPQSGLAHRIRH